MDGGQPQIGGASGAGGIPIKTSQPDSLLRHNISDEQLQMLSELRRDGLYQLGWASIGGIVGSLGPSAEALWKAFAASPAQPLTILGLLNIAILLMSITAAAISFPVARSRSQAAVDLVAQIRKQPAT